ncbi:MAG TPA: helicase-associated domain-containing protein, partial [Mycobacteriales bacterium]|nr:helicase-associated domain-containing protein [Mycobacteriales bacterium]
MPKSALPGSLNQLLSEFDKARLLHLLELRPDLVREDLPVPDPVSLAAKAALVPSVSTCLLELDLFQQLLVQALAAAPEPVTIPRLATLLGNIPTEDVRRGLVELEERALAAARGDAVWVLGSIRDMALPGLGPRAQTLATACSVEQLLPIATVLGVAPKSRRKGDVVAALCAALGDPGRLAPLVASAPGGTEELVSRLFTHPVVAAPYTSYSPRAAATSPTQWLANHGLLLPLSWGQVVMPREVAIALRGGQLFREVPTSPPALLGVPVDPSALDPGAATHALGTLGELARVLDLLAAAPAAELATGGIGVRELRRLGKRLGLEESIVARRLELADAMGLLGRDPVARTVLPATSYDRWLEEDPAGRWQAAVTGWRAAPRSLSAATTLDPDTGKPRPALVGARGSYAPALRRALLTALAGAAGSVPLESLHRRLRFDRPALCAGTDDELPELAALLVEAEELGLVAGGALTGIGQLVAAGAVETAAAAVGGYGPAASDRLLISGDLTALAAGTLPNVVSGELALIADVISRDLATTYRFSEASLRRGFDAGRTSEQILDFLDRHAERGVPQALSYLVGDLGRRHGQLRVGDAVGYVRCADPALATELEHSRSLSRLGLRHLGGGVLVATVGTEE